jgi:hypothetical protein
MNLVGTRVRYPDSRIYYTLGIKIMGGVPARMEGLADRHQGVREGCTGGGADIRTVLPPGAIYALPQSTYICRVQSCVWRLPKY